MKKLLLILLVLPSLAWAQTVITADLATTLRKCTQKPVANMGRRRLAILESPIDPANPPSVAAVRARCDSSPPTPSRRDACHPCAGSSVSDERDEQQPPRHSRHTGRDRGAEQRWKLRSAPLVNLRLKGYKRPFQNRVVVREREIKLVHF